MSTYPFDTDLILLVNTATNTDTFQALILLNNGGKLLSVLDKEGHFTSVGYRLPKHISAYIYYPVWIHIVRAPKTKPTPL